MSRGTVLVVEDNHIVAKDIQKRLGKLDYEVADTASSGETAIQKAEQSRPDVVLMDIKLRGKLDGVEAAERIRNRLDIPVVYLTAYADDKTLERAKITQPFGYIVKPFDENALRTNIEIALFKHAMEKKIKDSERWLATTLKCIGDPTVATDADGAIKLMNPAAERLTGWTQDDVLGRFWRDIIQIVDEETGRPADFPATSALQSGVVVTPSNRLLMVDKVGSETPIEVNAAPIVDHEGNTSGVVLVFRDITETKIAEEALEQNRHLLQAVLNGVNDVIFLKNLEGHYILINAAGSRLLGRPEKDIIGKRDVELFGPSTASLMEQAHQKAVDTGKLQTFECVMTTNGLERLFLVSLGVCQHKLNHPMAVVGAAHDITEVRIDKQPLHQEDKLREIGRTVGELAHEMRQSLAGIGDSFEAIKNAPSASQKYKDQLGDFEYELSRITDVSRRLSALHWRSQSRATGKQSSDVS